jgi:hypothetical protein
MSSIEFVPIKDLRIERSIYTALTKISYSSDEQTTLSDIINDMLKEYLHTYILSKKMGHILLSKDILRVAINDMTDQEINEASITNALRYREGAILEHCRPSLKTYLELIKAFAKANKFEMEISKNPDADSQVLIISFKMGPKFTRFKGNTYRILLEEFANIERMEITDNSIYIEYKAKREQVAKGVEHKQEEAYLPMQNLG